MTLTVADIVSPGLTFMRIVREAAGTNSYHALEDTFPDDVQSTSVPICSSAFELCA